MDIKPKRGAGKVYTFKTCIKVYTFRYSTFPQVKCNNRNKWRVSVNILFNLMCNKMNSIRKKYLDFKTETLETQRFKIRVKSKLCFSFVVKQFKT